MPTAPTGMEPSQLDPTLPDEEAPARRSKEHIDKDSPAPGPHGEMAPPAMPEPDRAQDMVEPER
jgi:hypothetical protein